jgi:hypothetical protein
VKISLKILILFIVCCLLFVVLQNITQINQSTNQPINQSTNQPINPNKLPPFSNSLSIFDSITGSFTTGGAW